MGAFADQPPEALPLDGGGLGGGVAAVGDGKVRSAPNEPSTASSAPTPPSPTLPPSRGKGVYEHAAHAKGAITRARHLRGSMTLAEKKIWEELRKLKLNIRRQAPIGRYIADFALHRAKLVIEVDSPWHDDDAARLHDAERDAWLRLQGYRVLRIRGGDILNDPARVAEYIASAIQNKSLPLDGGGLGGGVTAAFEARLRSAPNEPLAASPAPTPPSPALPPSRGKGVQVRA